MECINCGAIIDQVMKYCPNCGSAVDLPPGHSKKTGGFKKDTQKVSSTTSPNQIQIQIETNFDHDEGYRECPKCDAMIPLSSITLGRARPTLGQWIGALFLGFVIYVGFNDPVESSPMYAKVIGVATFVLIFVLHLRKMFTRKMWICPACHKVNKLKN